MNKYDDLFKIYCDKYFSEYDFFYDNLYVIFKSYSIFKTDLNKDFDKGGEYGLMALDKNIYKHSSSKLKMYNNYILNPDDNIRVSLYYFKKLFDKTIDFYKEYYDRVLYTFFLFTNKVNCDDDIKKYFDEYIINANNIKFDEIYLIKNIDSIYTSITNTDLKNDIDNLEIILLKKIKFFIEMYNKKYNKNLILWNSEGD